MKTVFDKSIIFKRLSAFILLIMIGILFAMYSAIPGYKIKQQEIINEREIVSKNEMINQQRIFDANGNEIKSDVLLYSYTLNQLFGMAIAFVLAGGVFGHTVGVLRTRDLYKMCENVYAETLHEQYSKVTRNKKQ